MTPTRTHWHLNAKSLLRGFLLAVALLALCFSLPLIAATTYALILGVAASDAPASVGAQFGMLAMWWLRLLLALATGFFVVIVVIDKWWLRGFDTADELKKGNYAIAALYIAVIWVVLRAVN